MKPETFAILQSSRLWKSVSWLLTTAALFYLIYRLKNYGEYETFWHSFALADTSQYICLAAAVILVSAQLLIEARKWQTMLIGLVDISLYDAWWQVIYGNIAAFVTPYRLGEYPGRLLQMGYTFDQWRAFIGTWRDWLKDWRKWLRVLLLHLARYAVWGIQLWAVLYFCGIMLPPLQAVAAIASYYFVITFMPSMPAADVALKGGWAVVIFSHFTDNIPAIAVAVTLIWLINTVLPILLGIAFRAKR